MRTEDIIFLGAGASASQGAPLQRDLLKEYFYSYQSEEKHKDNKEMNERLYHFFQDFFGIDTEHDLSNVQFPTFEEILGIVELALERGESFKDYSFTLRPNKPPIQQIREDLILLIAIILEKSIRGKIDYHQELIKRLEEEKRLFKTGFISLNYDIIMDKALLRYSPQLAVDYGINFVGRQRPHPPRLVTLYKLHGSLNWLYCPTCISLRLTPEEQPRPESSLIPQRCNVCQSELTPIIVPPTSFKMMSNFYLQETWRKAESLLKGAKNIFFCGYSLPEADINVKYLLKRAELNSGATPYITVVNCHTGKSKAEKEIEEQRYSRFFKDKSKIRYIDKSFEDFCERGEV